MRRLIREAGRAAACLRRIDDAVERALHVGAGQQRLPLIDAHARVAGLLASEAPLDALETLLTRLAPPVRAQEQPAAAVRRLRGATLADVRSRASVGDEVRGTAPRRQQPAAASGVTRVASVADASELADVRQPAASMHPLGKAMATAWDEQLRRASTRPGAELRAAKHWADRLSLANAGVLAAETRTGRIAALLGSGAGTPDGAGVAISATAPSSIVNSRSTLRSSANFGAAQLAPRSSSGASGDLSALSGPSAGAAALGATGDALGVTGLRKLAALATEPLELADDASVTRVPWLDAAADASPQWHLPTQPPRADERTLGVAQPLRAIGPTDTAASASAQPGSGPEERSAQASMARRGDAHYLEPDLDLLLEQRLARLLRAEALAHGIDPAGTIR